MLKESLIWPLFHVRFLSGNGTGANRIGEEFVNIVEVYLKRRPETLPPDATASFLQVGMLRVIGNPI